MAAVNDHNDYTLFLDCLTSVLQDDTLNIGSCRFKNVLEVGTSLHEKLLSNYAPLREPALAIVSTIRTVILATDGSRSAIHLRKVIGKFHVLRSEILPDLWEKLSDSLGLSFDPILVQFTTEKMFNSLLKSGCEPTTLATCNSCVPDRERTASEECAVMYCGGYIVRKLEKRFSSVDAMHAAQFVRTLQGLCSDECDVKEDDTIEDFVTKWMDAVDRGGLKILNEDAMDLFWQSELCTYKQIVQQSCVSENICPDTIVEVILKNTDIQFTWCILALELDEKDSNELLVAIVQLWITHALELDEMNLLLLLCNYG